MFQNIRLCKFIAALHSPALYRLQSTKTKYMMFISNAHTILVPVLSGHGPGGSYVISN